MLTVRLPLLTVAIIGLSLFICNPSYALECANADGLLFTPPDDGDDGASTACGDDAYALGAASTAYGASSRAIGDASVALGLGASSSESSGIALGNAALSTADFAIAVGQGASANAVDSVATGRLASTSGEATVAIGYQAIASEDGAVSVGTQANAGGLQSTALGFQATASGLRSIALGEGVNSTNDNSIALGTGASATNVNSIAIGPNASSTLNDSIAIGPNASAVQEFSMVLGSIAGVNDASLDTDIAIGTQFPAAPLHVARSDGSAQVLVEDVNTDAVPRTLFRLASGGSNAKFEIDNTSAGEAWAFTNSGIDFRISRQGSGEVEFRVDNNGDAFVAGLLFENSDREAKTNITPVDTEAILAKVAALPISQWAYKETPDAHHIGPMAQDFHAAFATGSSEKRLATMDVGGAALASIQALEMRNRSLEQKNLELESRLASIEAALSSLMPHTTHQ